MKNLIILFSLKWILRALKLIITQAYKSFHKALLIHKTLESKTIYLPSKAIFSHSKNKTRIIKIKIMESTGFNKINFKIIKFQLKFKLSHSANWNLTILGIKTLSLKMKIFRLKIISRVQWMASKLTEINNEICSLWHLKILISQIIIMNSISI